LTKKIQFPADVVDDQAADERAEPTRERLRKPAQMPIRMAAMISVGTFAG